ncbi:MAG: glycoside hydrolase family 3 protein, partial [Pirellulaceae bacterium]|nr:glycoside hydrolase family 3 protein [Pirellulaceae bacterium]
MIDLNAMRLEQKIAQMLVSFRFGNNELSDLMLEHDWGGIHLSIWDYTDISGSRAMIDEFQRRSRIPLIISSDTETGAGQLTNQDVTQLPCLMAISATGDAELSYRAGRVTGMEAASLGMNASYTPVVDVNTNPNNPSTNTRSFGDRADHVGTFAEQLIRGQSETGLASTAKHFPGQGAQDLNSHHGLEVVDVSRQEMEQVHLAPFRRAIAAGVPMVMTNHAIYNAYDRQLPATLSKRIVTDLLRSEMGFGGLIVTDCLEMRSVKDHWSTKDAAVLSVLAGNDIVLTNSDPLDTYHGLVEAVREGRIAEARIDDSVRRILAFKQSWHIMQWQDRGRTELDFVAHRRLADEIAERSVTLVKDGGVLPLVASEDLDVLVIEPAVEDMVKFGVHIQQATLAEPLSRAGLSTHLIEVPFEVGAEACHHAAQKAKSCAAVVILVDFRNTTGQCQRLSEGQQSLCRTICEANSRVV